MNEQPKSLWTRPVQGWQEILCWFVLLAIVAFITALCLDAASVGKRSTQELILSASIIATALVGLILFIRWLCCWRNFKRFLFVAACIVTLLALALTEENWRGRRAWEIHKRGLEAQGEKLTLPELLPPAVPDEQNFALTPLLRPLYDFARTPSGLRWNDTNDWNRLDRFQSGAIYKLSFPGSFGDLQKGTFDNFESWLDAFRKNTNYTIPEQTASAPAAILAAMSTFEPEFRELREAATTRPLSRFPIHYQEEPTWGILLPHLSRMKGLAIITHIRAVAEADAGLSAESLTDVKLCLRISDSISNEPLLIDHLVRVATLDIALQAVREGLVRHIWNGAQLAELESRLGSINLLAEYNRMMRGERGANVSGLDYLRTHASEARSVFGSESGSDQFGPKILMRSALISGFLYQNMVALSQIYQDYMLKSADPEAMRVFPEVARNCDDTISELATHRFSHPYHFFVRMFMPALTSSIIKTAREQTFVDAARLGCALERFRIANGKFPESLDALVPRFIESIPTDVMDGKPLRYNPDGNGGYRIYSIGWNQKDEGGRLAWTTDKERSLDNKDGDWVWQMPAKLSPEWIAPRTEH